jgi:hypothetical protein
MTGPVVRRIFELFVAGQGLKQISNTLTDEGIPSPSAHDRRRNENRDPRGWAHSAVRTILRNEKYLGRSVWGKQVRTDELYDLDDVAAGYVTRQRWTDRENWTVGPDNAHPALIDQDLWDRAQARIAVRGHQPQTATRSPRTTPTQYMLRGLVHCGICERKMEGTKAHGIHRYRCMSPKTRALPAYQAAAPRSEAKTVRCSLEHEASAVHASNARGGSALDTEYVAASAWSWTPGEVQSTAVASSSMSSSGTARRATPSKVLAKRAVPRRSESIAKCSRKASTSVV